MSSCPQDLPQDRTDRADRNRFFDYFFLSAGFIFCYDGQLSKQMPGPVKSSRTKNLRLFCTTNISKCSLYSIEDFLWTKTLLESFEVEMS